MFAIARSYKRRITRSLEGCRFKLSLGLLMFDDGFCFDLFGFLIALPFLDRYVHEPKDMLDQWRIYLSDRAIRFFWGSWYRVLHLPWEFNHLKVEVQRPDGTWAKQVQSYDVGEPDGRQLWTLPYRYVCKSGEVQEATATVYVERHEWRWRSMMWCPLTAKVRKSIDITFDREMGDRAGSWKGGCIATGYDIRRGESVEQTVRRMEREHSFR